MIDSERIRNESFVQSLTWLEEVASTNTYLLKVVNAGDPTALFPMPMLVGADRQTQGRGRGRNRWWAAEGALTFSLIFEPVRYGIPVSRWPMLSLASGLAICESLEGGLPGRSVRVKWPNDVYVDDRKLCGILIESATLQDPNSVARVPHPPGPTHLVIGVGVNVNNSLKPAPEEIRSRAVSMHDLLGHPVDLTDVLLAILRTFEGHLDRFDAVALATRWQSRCYLTGKCITIAHGPIGTGPPLPIGSRRNDARPGQTPQERETTGTCLGIDEDGALRLLTDAGEQRFFGGTVRDVHDR